MIYLRLRMAQISFLPPGSRWISDISIYINNNVIIAHSPNLNSAIIFYYFITQLLWQANGCWLLKGTPPQRFMICGGGLSAAN